MTPPITACEWRIGPPGFDEIRIVEREGGRQFAVVANDGRFANKDRLWEPLPHPSVRGEDFYWRTRWDEWEEAARVAVYMFEYPPQSVVDQ